MKLVVATNVNLRDRIAEGLFQEDLYYRLRGAEVRLPPLRARLEEIPYLVRAALALEGVTLPLSRQLIEACVLHPWPGNVRELLAAVRTAARSAFARNAKKVEVADLPADARPTATTTPTALVTSAIASLPPHRQLALEAFRVMLEKHGGSVKAAAQEAGIDLSTAYEWKNLLGGKPRRQR